jgi:hypothetical protein
MTKAQTNGCYILASIPVIGLSSSHFLLDSDSNALNGIGISLILIVMLFGFYVLYLVIAGARVKWLRKSAEKGNAKAQYLLGHRLLRRKSQSKSVVKCYTKATEEEQIREVIEQIIFTLRMLFQFRFISVFHLLFWIPVLYFFLEPVLNALSYIFEPVLNALSYIFELVLNINGIGVFGSLTGIVLALVATYGMLCVAQQFFDEKLVVKRYGKFYWAFVNVISLCFFLLVLNVWVYIYELLIIIGYGLAFIATIWMMVYVFSRFVWVCFWLWELVFPVVHFKMGSESDIGWWRSH